MTNPTLAGAAALVEKGRRENGDYPEAKRDCADELEAALATPPADAEQHGAVRYDAGLLSDYGGGDVNWWWDYIRAELDRAHDFYTAALTETRNVR